MKRYFSLILFICLFTFSPAQNGFYLKVNTIPLTKNQKELFYYKNQHPDSIRAVMEVRNLLRRFHNQSYLTAGIDTFYKSNDTLVVFFHPGESFEWVKLSKGNLTDILLNKSSFKEKFFTKAPFKFSEIADIEENVIKHSENHGFPFAYIFLDSLQIKKNKIFASLNYQSGPLIVFDSLSIVGKTKIKKKFLIKHLRIFPDEPFSQEKINSLNKLLRELPYIRQTRPYILTFHKNKAVLQLFIEDRRSNQVDGIIGFLPNENPGKKILITGELNLNLKNLFGSGKVLGAQWKKYNLSSQTLDLMYYHPKILSSNMDVQLDFNLLKQDSSYLNISRKLTLSQRSGKQGRINLFGGLNTSRELISNKVIDKSLLPPYSDYDYHIYGLGYDWNRLDDIFYPHKGWFISAKGLIGNKNIHKINGFNDSLYNHVQLRSVQMNANFRLEKFFPIKKRSVLLAKADGGTVFNNQNNIFLNDMYRVGGLKSLRGFNENYFFASSYITGTIEYRFFTDQSSFLFLFYDQGYIFNPLNNVIPKDYPYGFGAGISFTTDAGIFNFVYSIGQSKSQPLSLNLSKIHFGMISRF